MIQNKKVSDAYRRLAAEIIRNAAESKSDDAEEFLNSRWAELLADFCGVEAALEEIRRRRAGRKKMTE